MNLNRSARGHYLTVPGAHATRFELVPGNDGTGHAGYVVLLDHTLRFAWPTLTEATATRMAEQFAASLRHPYRHNFRRAAHTYQRYTGWRRPRKWWEL